MTNGALFVEERKQKILEHIAAQRKATVMELCELFRVSSATIRNDLRDLEAAGLLLRTHGGAMVKSKTGQELDMRARGIQNLDAKRAIARAALALIEDGDMILLDTGSTVIELAKLLDQKRDITVVTNDLVIATLLEELDSVKIVFIGATASDLHDEKPTPMGKGAFTSGVEIQAQITNMLLTGLRFDQMPSALFLLWVLVIVLISLTISYFTESISFFGP